MPLDGAKFGSEIVLLVREFVARELGRFGERAVQMAARLDALEARAPVPGPPGDPGRDGESIRGQDGKDADPEVMRGMVEQSVAVAWNAMPKPQDGRPGQDGKSVDLEDVRRMVLQAVAEIPPAKDGAPGADGSPGSDGRDALMLDILPAVDVERRYARNTYARHAGGLIRAFRDTDAITLAEIEKSGWECVLEGISKESEEVLDGGRLVRRLTLYTSGRKYEREFRTSAWVDRGVWREGPHEPGDVVTWSGSSFVAQCDTAEKPDPLNASGAWRLIAKRGRDGKDAK